MTINNPLALQRQQKDDFFKTHQHSPLPTESRKDFKGLDYYEYNADLNLTVTVTPFEQQESVPIQTTTGEIRQYTRYGNFTFSVDGEDAQLTIYETPHGYFLPFVDSNAGNETYGAGRYLDLERLNDDSFHVDFNLAYNPYCAYNEAYSCPITPAENRLKVPIRAGEKTYNA